MKTVSIKFVAALLIAISLLPGCASKKDKLTFHDVALKEGETLPDKDQLKQERAKIVVLESENRIAHSKDTQSGEAFALAIEKELNESATEVVDRKIASLLGDELKLAELNGTGSYSGPQVAQYAVRGQINSVEYTVTKSAQLISKLFKNKNDIPVRYDHKVKIGGTIKIYELPGLRMLTAIGVTGTASESEAETGENDATRAALLRTAIDYAISDQSHEFKNYFAPKGYVVEGRANASQSMFKVLMGRGQGVKPGHYVVLYSPKRKQPEALTGKAPMEEIQVARGWIADNVGDYVKVRYEANSLLSRMIR
jgi:hypothetical protein